LVLHGGGIEKREFAAMHRFVELAGGKNASIVVVLTAAEPDVFTGSIKSQYRSWWQTEFGVTKVDLIDTRSRDEADSEAFVGPIRNATGVWILGGKLTYLLDVYLGTRTQREIEAVVQNGGVVAGSSAGAMIQGSFLINVTKTPTGKPLPRSKMYLDPGRLTGFGLLKNTSIYPHLSSRHAQDDITEVVHRYPKVLAIGIDENTAIIVHQDQFEVIGPGTVTVFDNLTMNKMVLHAGQRYDLKQRRRVE
jgi:cyanophycinase